MSDIEHALEHLLQAASDGAAPAATDWEAAQSIQQHVAALEAHIQELETELRRK